MINLAVFVLRMADQLLEFGYVLVGFSEVERPEVLVEVLVN